jgi:hypothetical protein
MRKRMVEHVIQTHLRPTKLALLTSEVMYS